MRDNNDLHFYNGQSLIRYDWFNSDGSINKLYTFSDPDLTGNFMLKLGSNGVYFGTFIETELEYMKLFQNKLISNDPIIQQCKNSRLSHSSILFEFEVKNEKKRI